jgi:hypothetical protein
MSKNVIYFVPKLEGIPNWKHLLFLQNSGFSVIKIISLETLPEKVKTLQPVALILNDEAVIKDVLPLIGELPIIVLSKANKNISEIMSSVPETSNVIFFRTENDPIDSLLETVWLCNRLYNEDKVETQVST